LPNRFIVALLVNNLNKDYKYIVTVITQSIRTSSNINLEEIIEQLLDESRRLESTSSRNKSSPNNTSYYSTIILVTYFLGELITQAS
jgi:lipopolysaccharide biosynthesis glycosyltransferase